MKPAIADYLRRKETAAKAVISGQRHYCFKCRHPQETCYCARLRPFTSHPEFLILMHPHEAKKAIGTGRMAHHCLANSQLWVAADFAEDLRMQKLLRDPNYAPVLLYPGVHSLNLTQTPAAERPQVFASGKIPLVIVLDATWIYAKKMLYRSPNLQALPRISFDTPRLSRFLMRKQPAPECLSTIEAIHEVIELLAPRGEQSHAHLLEIFEHMVQAQLDFQKLRVSRHKINYLKRKGLLECPNG